MILIYAYTDTQKLNDRLNVAWRARNNLAAFRSALEQHFKDQWTAFESTVVKKKNRLL